jgi:endonuclease-3
MIINKFEGELPTELDDLMQLPGVDEEMAKIVHQYAWNDIERQGVPVDTRVHRMLNKLQWVGYLDKETGACINTQLPWETKTQIEAWLPKDRWPKVNAIFKALAYICNAPIMMKQI